MWHCHSHLALTVIGQTIFACIEEATARGHRNQKIEGAQGVHRFSGTRWTELRHDSRDALAGAGACTWPPLPKRAPRLSILFVAHRVAAGLLVIRHCSLFLPRRIT